MSWSGRNVRRVRVVLEVGWTTNAHRLMPWMDWMDGWMDGLWISEIEFCRLWSSELGLDILDRLPKLSCFKGRSGK